MKHSLIDERVTTICELGCTRVREVMGALEQGASTPETEELDEKQRAEVLRELQAIMAVYDARG